MPAIKPEIQDMVEIVADKFEDKIIRIKGLAPDKVHPTSTEYKRLAKRNKIMVTRKASVP